jgi:hypothetical protein
MFVRLGWVRSFFWLGKVLCRLSGGCLLYPRYHLRNDGLFATQGEDAILLWLFFSLSFLIVACDPLPLCRALSFERLIWINRVVDRVQLKFDKYANQDKILYSRFRHYSSLRCTLLYILPHTKEKKIPGINAQILFRRMHKNSKICTTKRIWVLFVCAIL